MDNTNLTHRMPLPSSGESEDEIDIRDLIEVLRRRKLIVISFLVIVCLLVAAYTFLSTPIYKATCKILVEKNTPSLININDDELSTWADLIKSRRVALEVIRELDLKSKIKIADSTDVDDESLVDWYLRHLQVSLSKKSRVIQISFLNSSPELAANVANAHAQIFMRKNFELQASEAQKILNWLQVQLEKQKKKIEEARRAVYEYKKKNDIVTLEEKQNTIYQKIQELNSLIIQARADRIAKENAYKQLRKAISSNGNLLSLPEITQDPLIQNLKEQLISLRTQYQELSTKFGPKHPKMVELASKIKQVQQDLKVELSRLASSLKAEVERAVALEESLNKALQEQKKLALELSQKAVKYELLKQEVESNQHMYDLLFKQAAEVKLLATTKSNNVRIIDPAEIPKFPVKPKVFLNLVVAVVTGIFGGVFLAFLVEFLDDSVKTPEDVRRRLGLSVIGVLPLFSFLQKEGRLTSSGRTIQLVSDKKKNLPQKSNYYKGVPHNVIGRLPFLLRKNQRQNKGQIISVQSATEGEGKTTVLSIIGANLSQMGFKVVLVDCDFYRPMLGTFLGFEKSVGGLAECFLDVISCRLKAGDLKRMNAADLFFLISVHHLTGKLSIFNNELNIVAYFKKGQLLFVQDETKDANLQLSNFLLKIGHLTKEQLDYAIERQKHLGHPLPYILINLGFLSLEKVQGLLRIQMEEHLQKMFSLSDGQYIFDSTGLGSDFSFKICDPNDFSAIIERLSRMSGYIYLKNSIFSRLKVLKEDRLYVLPAGYNSKYIQDEGFNISILERFFNLLAQDFDIVLVDLPPVLVAADSLAIQNLVDGCILVVKAGDTSSRAVNQAIEILEETGVKIIGVVLNQVKMQDLYYGYRYYGYYRKDHEAES